MTDKDVNIRFRVDITGDSSTANKIKTIHDATQKAAVEERHLATEVKNTNEELKAQEKFAKSAISANIDAAVKARQAQQASATAVTSGASASRGGSGIAGVAQRAAGAVGLGGVQELSGIIDDVGDFTKAIGESGVSAKTAVLSLGAAGIALAAIGIAVKVFSDNLDKGARVVQQAVDSLGTYYKVIQDGTTESVTKQLEAAKAQKEAIDAQIAAIDNARNNAVSSNDVIGKAAFAVADVMGKLPKTDELTKQSAAAQSEIDGLTRALDSSAVAANNAKAAYEAESKAIIASVTEQANQTLRYRQAINSLEGQSAESLKKRADSLKDEIKNTTEYLNTLQSTGEPSAELDRAINQAMLDLQLMTGTLDKIEQSALPAAAANERYKKSLEGATKAADEYAKNSRAIMDIEADRARVLEDRARTDARNSQIEALQSQISAAKEVEAQQAKSAKIVDLRNKAGDEEAKAVAKVGDDIAKVNRDYMAAEMQAVADYRKEELRAGADHNLQRARQLQDLYDTLSETAAKGDVTAFIRAQRAGTKDITRGDQDFGIASGRRAEDFQAGAAQRAKEREERLRELQQQFAEERNARQANLRAEIAAEQVNNEQKILRSQQLEAQLSALREQFAAEDVKRQRALEDKGFADQIKALTDRNKQIAAQIAKFTDPAINATKRLFDQIAQGVAQVRAAASGSSRPITHSSQAGGAVLNADGGIYTTPTLTMMGERRGWGDAVLPFRQSEGIQPALRRIAGQAGGGDTINVSVTTGSIASKQDVQDVKDTVMAGFEMARARKKGA